MTMTQQQRVWFVLQQQQRRKKPHYILDVTGTANATPTDGTLVFSATEDLTVVSTGDVGVSTAREDDATFRQHTVTVTCPTAGSGTIIVKNGMSKIVSLGNHRGALTPNVNFYTGTYDSAPILHWDLDKTPKTVQKIRQVTAYTVILPATGTKAMPTDLTYLLLSGNNINWTGWGLQPAWTASARVLTALNFLVNIGNVPTASVAETQNWIDRAAALANAGTATLTFRRTSTVGDGVDTTPLTNLGYTVVLGV